MTAAGRFRILVPIGCRSDEGLSAPVIKRLRKDFDVQVVQLEPQNFLASYEIAEYFCKAVKHIGRSEAKKPDLMLITGDRVEMCAAAAAAFHNKVKIAHLYAGIINDPITTFDDIDRHCITLWSDIIFTESEDARLNAANLVGPIKSANIFHVGITHLDDIEVEEFKVPRKPYDLVLINSEPLLENIPVFCEEKSTVWIGSNPDGFVLPGGSIYYANLPRPQFLSLLKNCDRFITNSSSAIYEAPHFLQPDQIVMIGDRNRNRPRGPFQTGASDSIVKILKEYFYGRMETPEDKS